MASVAQDNEIRLRYLAFACFAATTLIFSPNLSIFSNMELDPLELGRFVFPMFITIVLIAAICLVLARKAAFGSLPSIPLLAAAVAVHVAMAAFFVSFTYGFKPGLGIVSLVGVLYGASLVLVCLAWARLLACLEFRRAILYCTLVCIASYATSVFLALIPAQVRGGLYLLVFLVGSFAPLAFLYRGAQDAKLVGEIRTEGVGPLATVDTAAGSQADVGAATDPQVAGNAGGTAQSGTSASGAEKSRPRGGSVELLETLRLPLVGLLLFAFMMSISKNRVFDAIDIEYLGGALAALLILPLFALKTDKPLAGLIYRVIAPAVAGIVVVLLAASPIGDFTFTALVAAYAFLSALAILAFANIVAIMEAEEFSAELVASSGLFAGSLVSLGGIAWTQIYGAPENMVPVLLLLIALYCAFMMIYFGWESWSLVNKPIDERGEIYPASSDWAERAQAAKLTKREIEILSYLGRGHSVTYIAEKLFISESTVRTHVKHIYAKLDIHTKEELFAFVDGVS